MLLIGKIVCKAYQFALWTATAVLGCLAILTFCDVLGRYLFLSPVPGTVELTESLMAALIFGSLAVATHSREHIRVEILLGSLSETWKLIITKLGDIGILAIALAIAWSHADHARHLMATGDLTPVLRIPLFPSSYIALGLSSIMVLIAGHIVFSAAKKHSGEHLDNSK